MERRRNRNWSSITSASFWRSRPVCMMTRPAPVSAATLAIPGSRCRPQTSLMTCAPLRPPAWRSRRDRCRPRRWRLRRRASRTTGSTRACSVAASMALLPGRVDSPPTSTIAAPSAIIRRACANAALGRVEQAAVRKRIGRHVEHAHDQGHGAELEFAAMRQPPDARRHRLSPQVGGAALLERRAGEINRSAPRGPGAEFRLHAARG